MSLFIGNLSKRVHKEELEHVFQRFGRCTVQVKEGYGFAVYEIRAQAETALRQLRGKKICGSFVTLSWSNKQPRPVQSFTRDGGTGILSKMPGGRGFVRRDGGRFPDRQRFNGRRDYQFKQRQRDDGGGGRRLDSAERHVEKKRPPRDHEGWDNQSHRENARDSDDNIDHNGLGASRWDDEGDNGMEFERYEPDHASEEKAEGNQVTDYPVSKEICGDEIRTDIQRDAESCSVCGSRGHNMQDCPGQDVSGSKILENSRNSSRLDTEFTDSKPRAREFSRNGAMDKQYRSSSKDSGSGNPGSIKIHVQGADRRIVHGKELGQKRQIENENADPHNAKRAKKSGPSSHKYRPTSRRSTSVSTSSRSSSSASSSLGRSKSVSSSSYSPRSNRVSDRGRSGIQNARSKPRSRSNSPTSVSLHQPVSSHPPSKLEIDLNQGPIVDIDSVEIKHDEVTDNLPSNGDNNGSGLMIPSEVAAAGAAAKNQKESESLEGVKLMPEANISGSEVSIHPLHQMRDYSISPDELTHVLKHYNLECSVGGQQEDVSIEEYFGCSRLWPWGIIYYRRLKKGAVSTENYARRLAQNREYGIMDRYVRSSSGWGEPRTTQGC